MADLLRVPSAAQRVPERSAAEGQVIERVEFVRGIDIVLPCYWDSWGIVGS